MPYRIISIAEGRWQADGPVYIPDTGDAHGIQVGDDIYVLTNGEPNKLLARLSVLAVHFDAFRHRVDLTVGGARSAVFFDHSSSARPISLPQETGSSTRHEARSLDGGTVDHLVAVCGSHDFSNNDNPIRWNAIVRRVGVAVARALRDRDPRPDIEVAEAFLRRTYVTSELPGPSPVYLNAARLALGLSAGSSTAGLRRRNDLTDEAIKKAINEDVATGGHTPNTKRHQAILADLKDRLVDLGFAPKYNGLVDCIVENDEFDVYFEVKSTTEGSLVHQLRLGLGQVLHYIWMDSGRAPRKIRGHLVIEGPWTTSDEKLREFLTANSVRLTWSQDIPRLNITDL